MAKGDAKGISGIKRPFDMRLSQQTCHHVGHLLFIGATVSGWASTLCSIWALGGLQLFAIGIIGEYVGRTFEQSKNRPIYIAKEILDYDN